MYPEIKFCACEQRNVVCYDCLDAKGLKINYFGVKLY